MAGENNTNEIEGNIDLGTAIDQTVNPLASQEDLAIIQQAQSAFAPPPASTLSPITAIGDPGQAALMPGLSQPINVGQVGGQIIGSQPIFVKSGQVAPFGVFMEQQRQRQVAQQQQDQLANVAAREADLATKAQQKAFKFERPKIPALKDPGFQKSLNETGTGIINGFIDQAKQVHGADWQIALKSDTRIGREFQQSMDGINVLARNADLMTDKFAEVQEGIKTGETFFSDGVKEAFRSYEQMIGAFEGGDVRALANVRQVLADVDGHVELNNFLKDSGILSNVVGRVTGGTGVNNIGEFMELKTSDRKSYDRNIASMIQNVRKSLGSDFPYTDGDIRNALEGHFQNQSKSRTTLTRTPDKGLKVRSEDINFQEGEKIVTTTTLDKEGKPSTVPNKFNVASSMPLPQGKKGFKIEGVKSVNPFGVTEDLTDIRSVNPVSFQVIKFDDKDGNVQFKKVVTAEVERTVPVLGEFGDPTGKEKTIQETIQIDAESSEDQFRAKFGDEAFDAFNTNESKLKGEASGGTFTIQGESFTKEELLGVGWTEEQLKQL